MTSKEPTPLDDVASRIDMKIIHSGDDPERGNRFRETVLAVYDIIERKLYREKRQSIETYFKSNWQISRAQAYRLYNCGIVIRELADLEIQPTRERYCRILKSLAKTAEDRRRLWNEVLKVADHQENLITSGMITQVWERLQKAAAASKVNPLPAYATPSLAYKDMGSNEQMAVQALLQSYTSPKIITNTSTLPQASSGTSSSWTTPSMQQAKIEVNIPSLVQSQRTTPAISPLLDKKIPSFAALSAAANRGPPRTHPYAAGRSIQPKPHPMMQGPAHITMKPLELPSFPFVANSTHSTANKLDYPHTPVQLAPLRLPLGQHTNNN